MASTLQEDSVAEFDEGSAYIVEIHVSKSWTLPHEQETEAPNSTATRRHHSPITTWPSGVTASPISPADVTVAPADVIQQGRH